MDGVSRYGLVTLDREAKETILIPHHQVQEIMIKDHEKKNHCYVTITTSTNTYETVFSVHRRKFISELNSVI